MPSRTLGIDLAAADVGACRRRRHGLQQLVDALVLRARPLVIDFIHNFGPEAPLISGTHHAWIAGLLGDRLAPADADLLTAPSRAIPAGPDPGWFGPRTLECDAFLASLASITEADADQLVERWDRDAHEAARLRLLGVADLRARRWGVVASDAHDAVERALTGASGGFRSWTLDHPWRRAAYVAGAAASAECVRDAAAADLIEKLEAPWVAVMGRRELKAWD